MDTSFDEEQYRRPFPPGIERHYWHAARNRILWRKIRRVIPAGGLVVDIGCGPGIAVDALRRRGVDAIGVDTGQPPARPASVASHLFLGTSAFELSPSIRERATLLLLLDVLEHLEDPHAFLVRCAESFPNAKHVFVTVPARMELWSNYDEYYGHQRRYTRKALAELGAGPYRLVESGHFFHALYLAGLVAKAVGGGSRSLDVASPRALAAHRAVGWLFDREEALLHGRLPGSSLYALFAK